MDFLLLQVRAGGRVAFKLVALRRLMRHDPFAIFAVFVFRIFVAVATASSASQQPPLLPPPLHPPKSSP